MHYILLTIALNLGTENINYIKLADAKPVKTIQETKSEKTPDSPTQNLSDSNIMLDPGFMNAEEPFTVPYVSSNNFADLLPEDEQGNVVYDTEQQGPSLLDSIKNRLIKVTEKKETAAVIGSQVEGPTIATQPKKTVTTTPPTVKSTTTTTEETTSPNFIDNIRNIISGKIKQTTEPVTKTGIILDIQQQGPNIISKIKDKTIETTTKIKSALPTIDKTKTAGEEQTDKISIVGTLFDSEYNQALKGIRATEYSRIQSDEILKSSSEVTYEEDKEYQKFLDAKDAETLAKPEKILIPLVKPRQKELSTFKTQEVPEELLADRSYQNRHIPKIMQQKDKEKLLEQIIEYGMITEFRAFMNDLRDANTIMENQYTLLTYATKYKQYEIMKYLIHIGADVNKRDNRLDTPLIIAVYNNDMEAVKILTNANANLNKTDVLKRTPLTYCIEKNQELIGAYLVENGADVNIPSSTGEGMLAMSIRFGRNIIKEKILEVLKTS